jgi:hypothetical protein
MGGGAVVGSLLMLVMLSVEESRHIGVRILWAKQCYVVETVNVQRVVDTKQGPGGR